MHERIEPRRRDMSGDLLPLLSVVVPVYNERDVILEFHKRLQAALAPLPAATEIIYVNDGSRDGTLGLLHQLRDEHPNVAVLDLSRNFGKEIAMSAGLDHAAGDAVAIIDADLQDPPELIPKMFRRWREDGYDVVYAQRISRAGESFLKRATAHAFYRVINAISGSPIPVDTGDFRLLSRRATDAVLEMRERHRFMKGMFAWIGFPQTAIRYDRDPRFAGTTKWNYRRLWNLSIEGITSFSIVPLKLASYIGIVAATGAGAYGLYFLVRTLLFGNPVAGYPSLLVAVLFLGGVQLLCLGIIGEYLGRVFNETKRRPLYFVSGYHPPRDETSATDEPPAVARMAHAGRKSA